MARNFEAGNSFNLAVTAVVSQHSRVTVECYPLTSKICNVVRSEILAGNSFIVRCHVTSKKPMRARAVGKKFPAINNWIYSSEPPDSLTEKKNIFLVYSPGSKFTSTFLSTSAICTLVIRYAILTLYTNPLSEPQVRRY